MVDLIYHDQSYQSTTFPTILHSLEISWVESLHATLSCPVTRLQCWLLALYTQGNEDQRSLLVFERRANEQCIATP
jgi:hypothetical protein